jgi:type II secretory pathway component PulK
MKNERGSAVLAVLTMLAVLTALIAVNGSAVRQLSQELRRIDEQQQQRLQKSGN